MRDLYDVLGVPRNATADEIRKAYRAIALTCHPDRVGNDSDAVARFREATSAYEVLSDPHKRRRYDRGFVDIPSVSDLFLRHHVGRRLLEIMLPTAPAAPQRGADRIVAVDVPPSLLATGGVYPLVLPSPTGGTVEVPLVIPPNAEAVPYCRIARLGHPGKNGGEPGDVWIILLKTEADNEGECDEEEQRRKAS